VSTTRDVIARQQAALHAACRRHVGAGDRYALVDFPDHANVGDSAIWLGEIALLRAITGRDPDYVCTWDGFDPDEFHAACPTGVLFLHGGGNLGDIWPHHQRFRERLLSAVRDRPVVQLPQSVHFREPRGLLRFGEAVAAHPDVHLCVRDRPSLTLLREHCRCPVDLAPDSAFALGALRRAPPTCEVLMLLRTDAERVPHAAASRTDRADTVVLDWLDDGPLPVLHGGETRARHYERLAQARVARGIATLSRGRRIVTDRLHGHILATLLDIPHVALDNDYGKSSAYIAAWTEGSPLLARAPA
jgi:pyruvyl transferase EpsO